MLRRLLAVVTGVIVIAVSVIAVIGSAGLDKRGLLVAFTRWKDVVI